MIDLFYSPTLRRFIRSLTDLRPASRIIFTGPVENLTVHFVGPSGGTLACTGWQGGFAVGQAQFVEDTVAIATSWTLSEDATTAAIALAIDTLEMRSAIANNEASRNSQLDVVCQLQTLDTDSNSQNSLWLVGQVLASATGLLENPPSLLSNNRWEWAQQTFIGTNLELAFNSDTRKISFTFTGSAPPSGTAGGVLAGSYPNPSFAQPMATTAALTSGLAGKADLVDGVIPTGQIPAIALVTFLGVVGSQDAMLALVGQPGDWCNRSDTSSTWVLTANDPTVLSSWTHYLYPASPVVSVNGQVGAVVLGKNDVGLGSVTNDAQLKASQLDTDATMAANSNSKVPSQAAIRAYVAAQTPSGSGLTVSVKNANFTAAAGNLYQVDASGGAVAITMPSPVVGAFFEVEDASLSWESNNVTLTYNGDDNINGAAANFVADVNGDKLSICYINSTVGWSVK